MRVAIIGLGFGVASLLPAFQSQAGVEIVALCGSSASSARRSRKPLAAVPIWDDWRRVADDGSIDAVAVAVPPVAQQPIVCAMFAAGKHVLCEKPLGASLAEARKMSDSARATTRTQAMDFEFRMNPAMARMRELILEGAIGAIERIDVRWLSGGRSSPQQPFSWQHDQSKGGGILNSYASHSFDYLEWLTGSRITKLQFLTRVCIPQRPDGQGGMAEVTAEDACDGMACLANGAVAHVEICNCHAHGDGHRIEVLGSQGCLAFAQPPAPVSKLASLSIATRGRPLAQEAGFPKAWDNHVDGVGEDVARFVRQARGGPPALPDLEAGLRATQLIEAARNSALQKTWITISN